MPTNVHEYQLRCIKINSPHWAESRQQTYKRMLFQYTHCEIWSGRNTNFVDIFILCKIHFHQNGHKRSFHISLKMQIAEHAAIIGDLTAIMLKMIYRLWNVWLSFEIQKIICCHFFSFSSILAIWVQTYSLKTFFVWILCENIPV